MREEVVAGGMIASEGAAARMDDLSDRIDAIIRHASYLESQLRSVSDQLYQSQQNEVNLGRHVQHLEAQMRGMEDHLQQQQQQQQVMGGRSTVPIINAPVPTKRHSSPPPAALLTSGIPSSSTRELSSRAASSSNFPGRSPVASHPSYSSSFTRGTPSGALSHSSADAYQKLPPPPSPSIRRDEPHSPVDGGEKRYRN